MDRPPPPSTPDLWDRWGSGRLLLLTLLFAAVNLVGQATVFAASGHLFAAVAAGGVVVLLLAQAMSAGRAGAVFHLGRPGPGTLALCGLAGLAAVVPAGLLATLSSLLQPPSPEWVDLFNRHLPSGPAESALAYVAVTVLAPVAEELIFRGLLYRVCRRHWGVAASAAISALAFGLAHGEPWFLFGLVPLGVLLALLYEATGSVSAAAAAHGVYNQANLSVLLHRGGLSTEPEAGPVPWFWLLVSLALLAVVLRRLFRRRAPFPDRHV